jgi:RNA polymerase sigma factor (sigma-70 family)
MTDMLDRKIVEVLFRQNYSGMIRLARILLGDDVEAEDVVQDVFAKLLNLDVTTTITSGYLTTAVHHGCMNVIRKKNLLEKVQGLYPLETEENLDGIAQIERLSQIRHFIDDVMEEPGQSIFRLRFDNDLTMQEIAQRTGLSISTVHKYLHQGIQELKVYCNKAWS